MTSTGFEQVTVTPLKRIPTNGGDVLHALKRSDTGFLGFGETYFSWIEPGKVKAWKCHKRMTLNLVVPTGEVLFVLYEPTLQRFREELLGEARYVRLTIPPTVWFGFQGTASVNSLVMNIADVEHDPDEVQRASISSIEYQWRRR